MKNTGMTFSNKLELRYHFNEKTNYLDALIRHRCDTGRFGPSPARIRVAYRLS